jgi:hypothetical protein
MRLVAVGGAVQSISYIVYRISFIVYGISYTAYVGYSDYAIGCRRRGSTEYIVYCCIRWV